MWNYQFQGQGEDQNRDRVTKFKARVKANVETKVIINEKQLSPSQDKKQNQGWLPSSKPTWVKTKVKTR